MFDNRKSMRIFARKLIDMKKIYFFALLIVLFSCSSEKHVTVELTGINIETESLPFMRFPFRIGLDGSAVVMLDLAADSCFYHVASYPEFTRSFSVGRRGNGPDEMILPTPFQLENGHLFLYDGDRKNFFDIDLIEKQNTDLKERIQFSENPVYVDFVRINDSTVIFGDLSGENRLLKVTPHTRTGILLLPSELFDGNETDRSKQAFIWRSYMAINHELNRVALATQFGEVLEIVDLNDCSVKRMIGKAGVPKSARQQFAGYIDLKWYGNTVYALYSDINETEWKSQTANNRTPPNGGDFIQVFNQDGDKIMTYHLDTYINSFAIDEKNNLLIGITSDNDNPIYLFNM
jgi:hypothetical protein